MTANRDRAADVLRAARADRITISPEASDRALDAAGLLAPEPQVIRTRDELAALDPDTLVTLALPEHDKWPSPQVQAWPAPVAHRLDLTWSGPVVIIATGDHVRAARQALEES